MLDIVGGGGGGITFVDKAPVLDINILAQGFGILGFIIIVLSFQIKRNSRFFLAQGAGSLMFLLNYLLIGAFGGVLFNLCNLLRGLMFMRNPQKKWKLAVNVLSYAVSISLVAVFDLSRNLPLDILLCTALAVMSVFMWLGNSRVIRIVQIAMSSPVWLIYNSINLSIGGLLCESFTMVSSFIYLLRLRKEGK